MTPRELVIIASLAAARLPAYPTRSNAFVDDMIGLAARDPAAELTARQARYLEILAWRYRAQMPAGLIPAALAIAPVPVERPRRIECHRVSRRMGPAPPDPQLELAL